jgi:hypothetical protein
MYTYQEHYPNCYSLHRPDGTDFCFLQGDDAREFEKTLEELDKIEFPSGCFKTYEHLLSVNIDQYDTEKWDLAS